MRYLPLTAADRHHMLGTIGVSEVDDLYADVPQDVLIKDLLDLPLHKTELQVEQELTAMAGRNKHSGMMASFLGCGSYRHHVPAAVDHLIQRSEFLTSYTPYQPEISQGTLQYLFEFQTQITMLTEMEVANASLYDASTACGEAVEMARRITGQEKVILSANLHPQYADVIETISHLKATVIIRRQPAPQGEAISDLIDCVDDKTACVVVQYPDIFGHIEDFTTLARSIQDNGGLLIVVVPEIVALGAIMSPGAMGADIVVAEGQGLGVGLNYGGPYLGLFATKSRYIRQMPGRLVGQSVDTNGKRGYVLTLSAREQHIRREKATSNICTNSGLCCLAFTIHLALLGEEGYSKLAAINHDIATRLADRLAKINGVQLLTNVFFNEFAICLPKPANVIVEKMVDKGILCGVPASRLYPHHTELANILIIAVTEMNTQIDCDNFVHALSDILVGKNI